MNITSSICVLTVISPDGDIVCQRVFVNDDDFATSEWDRLRVGLSDLLLKGGAISLRRF